MGTWKRYDQEWPAKAGDYLVIFDPEGSNEITMHVASYYKLGDVLCIDYHSQLPGSAEEKLVDCMINQQVLAMKEGFYEVDLDDDSAYELKPVFWTELPDPPEGYVYLNSCKEA